ncbi:MAG: hypothetical protein AUJ92_04670 [Armatimonadetes bacterium CG2_30_59_28]|nr:MAG: hypothetical protein AUJ92_04670 [Armatimonadetes bacterium CG2_30_59_28]
MGHNCKQIHRTRQKEEHDESVCATQRLHLDRVTGGDRDHRDIGGDSVPRICAGTGEGEAGQLSIESETTGAFGVDVHSGLRREVPQYAQYDAGLPRYWTWPHFIYPYCNNLQLYLCPSDTVAGGQAWCGGWGWNPPNSSQALGATSYIHNASMLGIALADNKAPAERWMLMDGKDWFEAGGQPAYWPRNVPRHSNGSNIAYSDGHVKWLSDGYLKNATSDKPENSMFWNGS